jgi:hypothetical protein
VYKDIVNDTHRSSSLHTSIQVDESDPAWQALAERNVYDVRLYEEVIKLFDEQRKLFKSHAKNMSRQRRRPIDEDEDGEAGVVIETPHMKPKEAAIVSLTNS